MGRKPWNVPPNSQILRSTLTRPRDDFGPELRQTATSNNALLGFAAAGNQSVGIAYSSIFEHAIDLPANSFGTLARSREPLVRKSLRSDTLKQIEAVTALILRYSLWRDTETDFPPLPRHRLGLASSSGRLHYRLPQKYSSQAVRNLRM